MNLYGILYVGTTGTREHLQFDKYRAPRVHSLSIIEEL